MTTKELHELLGPTEARILATESGAYTLIYWKRALNQGVSISPDRAKKIVHAIQHKSELLESIKRRLGMQHINKDIVDPFATLPYREMGSYIDFRTSILWDLKSDAFGIEYWLKYDPARGGFLLDISRMRQNVNGAFEGSSYEEKTGITNGYIKKTYKVSDAECQLLFDRAVEFYSQVKNDLAHL